MKKDQTKKLLELLKNHKKTVSVAESCTAGLLAAELTKISGASKVFSGGFITYSNQSKVQLLNIDQEAIERFGTVSKEIVQEMASNSRQKLNSDYSLAISGIAGPEGGSSDKPVGTVWLALSDSKRTISKLRQFKGDREEIRRQAVEAALELLGESLVNKQTRHDGPVVPKR